MVLCDILVGRADRRYKIAHDSFVNCAVLLKIVSFWRSRDFKNVKPVFEAHCQIVLNPKLRVQMSNSDINLLQEGKKLIIF
jgi:hypothetical protein